MAHEIDIKIWLTRAQNSNYWKIRWLDPVSNQQRQKSAKTTNRRDAERQLGELRSDLLKGQYRHSPRMPWDAFRRRYEDEVMPSLAKKTQMKIATVFNAVEELIIPRVLGDLTTEKISTFQAKLREGDRAESTIAGYLAHLRSILSWAVEMEILAWMPKIRKPQRAKKSKLMKGRPITQAEYEQMLAAVDEVVGAEAAESWKHYLEGLWWSGLRLAESLELWWDNETKLQVITDGQDLTLRIPADMEKGNKDRILPIAPEFVEFLRRTPKAERTGRVFNLMPKKVRGDRLTDDRVIRVISKIGEAAGVVVGRAPQKYASAHDFRRAFGERWAERVMPQVLMELMRHESIETTLRYYVGKNARRTTRIVQEAYEAAVKRKQDADEKTRENDSKTA